MRKSSLIYIKDINQVGDFGHGEPWKVDLSFGKVFQKAIDLVLRNLDNGSGKVWTYCLLHASPDGKIISSFSEIAEIMKIKRAQVPKYLERLSGVIEIGGLFKIKKLISWSRAFITQRRQFAIVVQMHGLPQTLIELVEREIVIESSTLDQVNLLVRGWFEIRDVGKPSYQQRSKAEMVFRSLLKQGYEPEVIRYGFAWIKRDERLFKSVYSPGIISDRMGDIYRDYQKEKRILSDMRKLEEINRIKEKELLEDKLKVLNAYKMEDEAETFYNGLPLCQREEIDNRATKKLEEMGIHHGMPGWGATLRSKRLEIVESMMAGSRENS